jgi:hypothetical protein
VLVLKEGLVEMLAADLVSQANASGMGSAGFTDKTDSSLSNGPQTECRCKEDFCSLGVCGFSLDQGQRRKE